MRRGKYARAIVFIALFLVLFAGASKVLTTPGYLSYRYISGFYDEPAGSIDAVYVGSSGVFTSCLSPAVWERRGIAVWDFSSDSQPMSAARYLIEEARKTQPDALYLVYTGSFAIVPTAENIHKITDYMPASAQKLRLIHALCEDGEIPGETRAELYIPMIRYHSRWNSLVAYDFQYEMPGIMAYDGANFFTTEDISGNARNVPRLRGGVDLPARVQAFMLDLLSYCKDEGVNVLFVAPVAVIENEEALAQQEAVKALCRSWGFPVLDQAQLRDEIGMDLTQDYYNTGHTNIHGALKVSCYLADYLAEHYGFADKRGDPAYARWDAAYEEYAALTAPYVLDIEWQGEERDFTLAAPVLEEASSGRRLMAEISWSGVDGADGYRIYRLSAAGWTPVATVGSGVRHFRDRLDAEGTYTYTVIGYRDQDGAACWGCYDYAGVRVEVTK